MPIWVGVGGTPKSFARAGSLGLPLMIAVIGGEYHRFRPLVDLYRKAGHEAGHPPEVLRVGLHAIGFVGETTAQAKDSFYPGWANIFTRIGKERGWSAAGRPQFDAMTGPQGTFLIGDPDHVAEKVVAADAILGGLSRVTFQMSSASQDHAAMIRSITLLGTEVAPRVRRAMARG